MLLLDKESYPGKKGGVEGARPSGVRRWLLYGLVFLVLILLSHGVYGADEAAEEGKPMENPHWQEGLCGECHEGDPYKEVRFREEGDFIALCNRCHEKDSVHAYIHATGMIPSEKKLGRMPEDFRSALYRGDEKGRLTCIVCHNLVYQCRKEEFWRRERNPRFFRGGPYGHRTDICYKCHEPKGYTRMDPHDMINDEGEILTSKCVVCHRVVPDVDRALGIEDVEFKIEKNLERLCRRCHYDIPLHPGTFISMAGVTEKTRKRRKPFSHLRVPTSAVLKRLEKTTREKDIIIPLEPGTGKIFCATCHNPHERGIQRLRRADRGADNPQRLRAERKGEICLMCHEL